MESLSYSITPFTSSAKEPVMAIFNHYITHSFAAYREKELPVEYFDEMVRRCEGFPTAVVRANDEKVIGFGLLSSHKPLMEFSHTAEITYFLHHHYLGIGIGKGLLKHLEEEGKKKGITTLLASISSFNQRSQDFHRRSGFRQCGCFQGVGVKNGKTFDTIWMQKDI